MKRIRIKTTSSVYQPYIKARNTMSKTIKRERLAAAQSNKKRQMDLKSTHTANLKKFQEYQKKVMQDLKLKKAKLKKTASLDLKKATLDHSSQKKALTLRLRNEGRSLLKKFHDKDRVLKAAKLKSTKKTSKIKSTKKRKTAIKSRKKSSMRKSIKRIV